MPDGANVSFPDSMPKEQIRGLIAKKFPDVEPIKKSSWAQTMQARGADLANVVDRFKKGEQTLPETIYQGGMKGIVGTASDVAGEAIAPGASAVIPDVIKEDFALAGQQLGDTETVKAIKQKWDSLSDRQRANIEATGLLPVGFLAKVGSKAIAPAIKDGIKVAEELTTFEPKVLPKELENMDPLLKAEGSVLFNKTPNKLEKGLAANKSISKEYDIAKTKVAESENALRQTPLEIEAEDFIPQIKQSIGALSKKVAPGSNDAQAIKTLRGIMKKIDGAKKAPSTSSFGVPDAPRTINSNDALEIRKGINDIMSSPTFPSSGQASLLRIKALADKVLDKGASLDKDFGGKLNLYKTQSQDVAKRFTNNKSLKTLWQPEDYVSWKAAQNAAKEGKVISDVSDATITRANKFLENLNTKDAGKITSALNAMPKDQAAETMRAAFVLAKKEKISLGNAALQLITNPLKAPVTAGKAMLGKGGKQPIESYIKDVKKMKGAPAAPLVAQPTVNTVVEAAKKSNFKGYSGDTLAKMFPEIKGVFKKDLKYTPEQLKKMFPEINEIEGMSSATQKRMNKLVYDKTGKDKK